MFTIDLLKGQGTPAKSRPEGIAIVAATLAVPVIITIVMFGLYLRNKIIISVNKQEIVNYEKKIAELSDAVELQKSFENEKAAINSCLSEVSTSLGSHTQWSPVLTTLVKNMPDSVVLTDLEVKQSSVKRKVPKKDDPKIMIDISVPVRTLQINVCGNPQSDCDKAVRGFRERLRSSALLGPKLENIRVSQRFGTLQDQDVVSYQIDCIFKPGS
jgi:Tfp pilus assembly protein PilN